MTPRELVVRAVTFASPERVPRQLWLLPWARNEHPDAVARLHADYPDDIVECPSFLRDPLRTRGEPYEMGTYVDEWGCVFESRQRGIIGEVKTPLLPAWKDWASVRPPVERLTVDTAAADAFARGTDRFVLAPAVVRPFELLQFIRGPENLYMDLADPPDELYRLLERVHAFFKAELELWASTAVDALAVFDDWGSQNSLLIRPDLWRRIFRPIYADYVSIAHRHGKFLFMHSDGHIAAIMPDLVEMGVDAVNAQLFCMDIEALGRDFRGRIAFWGEVDRQWLLARGTPADVAAAVRRVRSALASDGGVIAQCEFGIGARPENVAAVFETWNRLG